jgi:hypothetical protein
MYWKDSYPLNQLRDYSTLFLRSEVKRWFKNDFNSINLKVKRYDNQILNKEVNYLNYLKHIYKILEKNYPNEYIYKNQFLNKWLIHELGNTDSVIFNEFRIGKAVADLAIFNGTSKVFEIKTILDKEYRLSGQLEEYKKIFNEIYLIIPLSHLNKYKSFDAHIGIIAYNTASENFYLIKKSDFQYMPDFSVMMEVLHTKEYRNIIKEYFGFLPEMNDFTQFQVCREMISKIPGHELNALFVQTIKKRNINNLFFNKINSELNQICLSLNLNKKQKEQLIFTLKTKISV